MKILIATTNKDKFEQIKLILHDIDLKMPIDIGISDFDVEENGDTLKANAYKKAKALYDLSNTPTIADDTGLFVDALDGRPGVYSHRYASATASYKDNRDKLLSEIAGNDNRDAHFKTVICFIDNKGNDHYFEGILDGSITEKEYGNYEFGYDQIFRPNGLDQTLGEMTSEEINQISHRSKAIKEFYEYLKRDTYEDTSN